MSRRDEQPEDESPDDEPVPAGTRRDPNPHDRLFRATMSVEKHAAAELRAVMPARLAAAIDWNTLREESADLPEAVGESRADLLFSARVGERDAYIYVLFEHQSSSDPAMLARLLIYLGRIWRKLAKKRSSHHPWPVIVPVVLHHGEGGWRHARRLGDLLDWDEALREAAGPFVPDFEVIIDDLARKSELELLRRRMPALPKFVLWLFRGPWEGLDPATVRRWAKVLNRAARQGPRGAIEHVLIYLVSTEEGAAILAALKRANISRGVQEVVMTLAEKWMAEGIAKGEAVAKAELLLKLIRGRFAVVPGEAHRRLEGASVEELDRWFDRALTAESLDDVWD